jgi:hypothetical protein
MAWHGRESTVRTTVPMGPCGQNSAGPMHSFPRRVFAKACQTSSPRVQLLRPPSLKPLRRPAQISVARQQFTIGNDWQWGALHPHPSGARIPGHLSVCGDHRTRDRDPAAIARSWWLSRVPSDSHGPDPDENLLGIMHNGAE